MRQMMTPETIQHNCDCFKRQMSRFIDFSDDKALMVNNAEWLMDLNYIESVSYTHLDVYKRQLLKGLIIYMIFPAESCPDGCTRLMANFRERAAAAISFMTGTG